MAHALLGVLVDGSPASVISQRKRFVVEGLTDAAPGSVMSFVQQGQRATEVRPASFQGELMRFGRLGRSERERTGIVVGVSEYGASFIDVDSGENVHREEAHDLELGDQFSFTVMSDCPRPGPTPPRRTPRTRHARSRRATINGSCEPAMLCEENDDLEELLYVLVTPRQATLLDELGWLETMLELGSPRELPSTDP